MILIIINFLLITSLLYLRKKDIKVAIIQSYLLTTGITLVFTEILSTFNLVTFSGLLISWSTLAVLLIFWRIRKYGSQKAFNLKEIVGHISTRRSDFAPEILMIFGIVLILVITLVIALFAPPNNSDSMTYHMARIVHWIQQRNVDFFTTSISRQNHSMPLAEYMILNLQLLSKSDRYANLVQWSAFAVLVLSVTQVANFLGVSKRGQLVSGFFMATIPMAILQSTSTQNDIVVSLFCLLFVYFLLRLIKYGSWLAVFYAGLSLGLALLTKGTAYIFCAATGITLGITGLILKIRERKIRLVLNLIAVILLALTLNSGYYQRNINLYSHPLSTETDRVTIDEFSLAGFYSNLIRNGSMHLAVPFPPANRLLTQVIEFLLQGQINSSATTFPGSEFEIQYLINEDESGNFLHFVLLITSLFFISRKRTTKDDYIPFYFFSVTASILLFSALLKWQPWTSRLQLPIFTMGSPLVGALLDRIKHYKFNFNVLILLFFMYCLPYIFLNSSRPLEPIFRNSIIGPDDLTRFTSNHPYLYEQYSEIIAPYYKENSVLYTDRMTQYFTGNMRIYQDYLQVMEKVNQLDEKIIGLYIGSNDWEYPFWVLADRHYSEGQPQFIHVDVKDISRKLDNNKEIMPEYVISAEMKLPEADFAKDYKIIVDTSYFVLLKKR